MYVFDQTKPIAIGCDHAGFDCKEDLISFLEAEGMAFKDFGAFNKDFLLIFFTNGPVNINQYFYRDQIASEEQIYFNALNN